MGLCRAIRPFFHSWQSLPLCLALCAGLAGGAQAAHVQRFSPQGEVREGQRATVVFSEAMVRLGDRSAPAPFQVDCPQPGKGQWSDARTWNYVLPRPLAAGERCDFRFRAGLKSLTGEALAGNGRYAFFAPGPWIKQSRPASGSRIEEDQVFLLTPSAPLNLDTVRRHAWCEAEGIAERIPVEILGPEAKAALAPALGQEPDPEALALHCVQRLAAGSRLRLQWGAGIETRNGIRSRQGSTLDFTVREPFQARLGCEREKADRPCSPLSDLRLELSEPISRKQAEQVRLQTPLGVRKADGLVEGEEEVEVLRFRGPFPAQASLRLELPKGLKDLSGRPLANASQFPLNFSTGPLPPLAKFPGRFGILELAEGGVLPVTLRQVEAALPLGIEGQAGSARQLRLDAQAEDAQVIATWQALEQFENQGRMVPGADGERYDPYYARELSFLDRRSGVARRELPKPGGSQAFEVVGIPLEKPGFYVVELESRLLGQSLLAKPAPMYVRTAALVTNLAVHFKQGRESSLVWVTSLDQGQPVAGARVRVSNCRGQPLWSGQTDAQGRARVEQALAPGDCDGGSFLFVSARQGEDFSFVRSDWNEGLEPWRFGLNTWAGLEPLRVHAVLDRKLLRAGETLSMKLVGREVGQGGLRYPAAGSLPRQLRIQYLGGEEEWNLPLDWDERGTAALTWSIPKAARVGSYLLSVEGGETGPMDLGRFQVSEFRLPVFSGVLEAPGGRQVAVQELPLQMHLAFLNGGPARGQAVQVSGTLQDLWLHFPGYEDFQFNLPRDFQGREEAEAGTERLIADKQRVTLDAQGAGKLALKLPAGLNTPRRFYGEMTFPDPNGAIQTITGHAEIWPAALLPGIRVRDWASVQEKGQVEVVVLDARGKPAADAPVRISGQRRIDYSHRKRIVGGFYAYEQHTEFQDLGKLCEGRSDARGRFSCEVRVRQPGNIQLQVTARDKQGNTSLAGTSYWVSGDGDVWFAQENQDRMDLLPERESYAPGETARFQVRTPFREATVLVAVEREGVVETFVRTLSRFDPVVEVPVRAEWAPNVYVSVLAVRGRVREVSWKSFFDWGWKAPVEWFKAWWNPPGATALVDLAKPAFKLGVAQIQVGRSGHELKVEVQADKAEYQPRDKARVQIRVLGPDGKPAPAGTQVALAAVDQALLELSPNDSWNLLDAMLQPRGYGVETATSQMQVVGKRHYGKKALPAGGGGGRGMTRELFDTLLAWHPRLVLDAEGRAQVEVPLNDALTRFTLVAVADGGPSLFGTGRTQILSRQDLQLIAGVPPLVREGDQYQALLTLRNASERKMEVQLQAQSGGRELSGQKLSLQPGEAREVNWAVEVPQGVAEQVWQWQAEELGGKARDSLRLVQQVAPAVPLSVLQASFQQLDGSLAWNLVRPAGALPGRGGVEVSLSPRLAGPPAGLRRYFEQYAYTCLEQRTSRAIGLEQPEVWQQLGEQLPAYLDGDGLARYFPGEGPGSEVLTAYLLGIGQAAGWAWPEAPVRRMEEGLAAFVEGRLQRAAWGNRDDLLERRLLALEALARRGKASARQAGGLDLPPERLGQLSHSALVDWFSILQRVEGLPQRQERLQAVTQELRNRLRDVGGRLEFIPRSEGASWWLMRSDNATHFRLMTLVLDDPAWKEDLPRLLQGGVMRQRQGHWGTTVANAWARLAFSGFARRFDGVPVGGRTLARLDGRQVASQDWSAAPAGKTFLVPWSAGGPVAGKAGKEEGAEAIRASEVLRLEHQGAGQPWAGVNVLAALPVSRPEAHGFSLKRSVTAVSQAQPGVYSRGDVLRVRLEVEASQPMNWVVVSDPVPAGASVLGEGLGRDSLLATLGERVAGQAWPAFEERTFSHYRAYYAQVPQGRFVTEYTLRLNNPGRFILPPTRVEAMYGPEWYGVWPNDALQIR